MYKTLVVVDAEDSLLADIVPHVVSFDKYLTDYPKKNELKTRIINLCDTEQYLSKGYYCSLLAEARRHSVLPSVKTINELRNITPDNDVFLTMVRSFKNANEPQEMLVYFGQTQCEHLKGLAKNLFKSFPAPILKVSSDVIEGETIFRIERFSYAKLDEVEKDSFHACLRDFMQTVWKIKTQKKRHRWDMAILIDPEDKVPPSNKEAIAHFVKAASKHGIHADVVTKDTLSHLSNYDALFIRETTAIDHHTYQLASKAEKLGLVTIDDSTSILRCCNKVFLHDAFSYNSVPSLRTEVLVNDSDETLNLLEEKYGYPLVLKMPEGSFSKGVYKVNNRDELQVRMQELFASSALVLAQEYLYTDFDWRVGILNGRVIYACKYLMARNHWQIYNHDAKKRFISGGFETLPTFEVPKVVLDSALRAANVVGNGLYGVDIKQVENKAYVIEVNDNPSIDHKVEDEYLGKELYMQIMADFRRRLEER